jgi:Zn-dependent protease with chaperone function
MPAASPDGWPYGGCGIAECARLRMNGRRGSGNYALGCGIARPVALLESCFTDAPVLIGYWRPVILLPLGCLTGLSAAQVECILLHELAHVMRHDYIVNLLQSLVEGLLFYHPAVWWVSRVVRAERENCCDDRVVELMGDATRLRRHVGAAGKSGARPRPRWRPPEEIS